MEEQDPIMEYGNRFKRVISMNELVENYERYKKVQRDDAENIRESSEARKYIIKNLGKADPIDIIAVACSCIADLTKDKHFEKVTRETISQMREGK